MPTLGQLRTNIKGRANITADSSFDSLITAWMNDAQRDIGNRYLFEFMRSTEDIITVNGTEEYVLAQPCIVYNARNLTPPSPRRFIRDNDYDRWMPDHTISSGIPRFYTMAGQSQASSSQVPLPKIQFAPIPNGVFTIRVRSYRRFPDLVNDSDYSLLPEANHELLINYVLAVLFSAQGDPRTGEQRILYENGLLSLVEQQGAQPADQIDVLRSTDETVGRSTLQLPGAYPSTF